MGKQEYTRVYTVNNDGLSFTLKNQHEKYISAQKWVNYCPKWNRNIEYLKLANSHKKRVISRIRKKITLLMLDGEYKNEIQINRDYNDRAITYAKIIWLK